MCAHICVPWCMCQRQSVGLCVLSFQPGSPGIELGSLSLVTSTIHCGISLALQFYIMYIFPQLNQDKRNVTSMCEVGGVQIAHRTQLLKCPGTASGTLQSSWPFKWGCHQENSSSFQEVAAACPGQKATAKNLLAPGWQPAVHLSAHIGIRRAAGAWYSQCCLCLALAPGGFPLGWAGWTAKAVTPGCCVPQGTSRRVTGLVLTIMPAQATLSACGGSHPLPPGSRPPPSAAFCAYPGVFWGHELVFSRLLKGTRGLYEQATCWWSVLSPCGLASWLCHLLVTEWDSPGNPMSSSGLCMDRHTHKLNPEVRLCSIYPVRSAGIFQTPLCLDF